MKNTIKRLRSMLTESRLEYLNKRCKNLKFVQGIEEGEIDVIAIHNTATKTISCKRWSVGKNEVWDHINNSTINTNWKKFKGIITDWNDALNDVWKPQTVNDLAI